MINTVGPGAPGTFEDLTDEQWRRSVENGVLGHGALRAIGTSAAGQSAMGPGGELLGALDAAAKRHAARLHGGQIHADERLESANINVDGGSDFT